MQNFNYSPEKGDFFVCLGEAFSDVRMCQAFPNPDDGNKMYATFYIPAAKGKAARYEKKKIEELKGPFFPSFALRPPKKDQTHLYKIYRTITDKIEDHLFTKDGYSDTITATVSHLVKSGESKKDSEAIIKILIGELLVYRYKKLKTGEYIEFSELKSDAEKSKLYYGSLAEEIKIKSDQISLLVSHGQTVGNYRELILRELLKKYIPGKFGIATGFIEGISRQIDIIIFDRINQAPVFQEGELVVVRRESVRAIIEVKSDLTTAKLQEALEFFYDISRPGIFKPDLPIFKGVFAFSTPYQNEKGIAKCIKDFYNKPYLETKLNEKITRDILYLNHELTCVAVLKKYCLFSKYTTANKTSNANIIPALFSISDRRGIDVQSAMFIALLSDYLDVEYHAKQSMLRSFSKLYRSKTADVKLEAKLVPDDWFPRVARRGEHDFKQESIKKRLEKIESWFDGKISSTEFIIEDERLANELSTEDGG